MFGKHAPPKTLEQWVAFHLADMFPLTHPCLILEQAQLALNETRSKIEKFPKVLTLGLHGEINPKEGLLDLVL